MITQISREYSSFMALITTHTHTPPWSLRSQISREYSSFVALITTRMWRFTSRLAPVGSESLGFSCTPPQCWEAERTVLTCESMDTRPLWALRPHEMGCPGGNTVKYKYGAGWPLPHFLSFSATMGGPPLTSRGSRSVWAEFQEEAGSWRPCPQTNITGAWVSFVKAQWQWIPISIWVLGKTLGVLAKQAHAGGYPECLGSGAQAWPVCELLQGRPGLCCTAAAQHRARHTVRAHQPSVLVQPRNPILRALALF